MPEITYGRWSPTEVMERVLDGTWVTATPPEPTNTGGVLMSPTSIAYTGTSASINTRGSVSFTACSSLSLNGVFTADYDNYQIMIRSFSTTADVNIVGRYRSSGVDASASNYTSQYIYANGATIASNRQALTYFRFSYSASTNRSGGICHVYGPYLAQSTASRMVTATNVASGALLFDSADTHSLSTSYDGITIYPESGTFTGLISVYGLKG